MGYHNLYLEITVQNIQGKPLEAVQCCAFPAVVEEEQIWWGVTWYMQTPVENLESETMIMVEIKHANTTDFGLKLDLFWTFFSIDKATIDSELASLPLFPGAKPSGAMDKRKSKNLVPTAVLEAELSLTKRFREIDLNTYLLQHQ